MLNYENAESVKAWAAAWQQRGSSEAGALQNPRHCGQ